MRSRSGEPSVGYLPWILGLSVALGIGILLRLEDPLSTSVLPAEDPYTHMALVQEHLRDGSLEPLYESALLYPPGMHILLAAAWVFSGVDLHTLFRFAPVFFGAVGILGIGLLLARLEGRLAGLVGAFAFAIAPEVVFRTTMMAPTAVDLALLPFLFLSLLLVLRGELAWLAAAIPLTVFLVFSHPWLMGIVSMAATAFLVLTYLLGWPRDRDVLVDPRGLAAAGAVLAGGVAMAAAGCWGPCGPGFRTVVGPELGGLLASAAGVLALAGVLLGAVVALWPKAIERLVPAPRDGPGAPWLWSLAIAGLLVAGTVPAVQAGFPDFVSPGMVGWPILIAAAVGLVALPYLASPGALLGASIFLVTYPFVIYNPFDSPFWPHRTAVYLAVGLTLLAAVAVARAATLAARTMPIPHSSARGQTTAAIAIVPLLVTGLAMGGAFAATPDASEQRWYRLYDECQFEALDVTADVAAGESDGVVVAGDWRPKLVLAGLTPNASRTWFTVSFYQNASERQGTADWLENNDRALWVVVDPHLERQHPDVDLSFLDEPRWEPVVTADCGAPGPDGDVTTYRYTPDASSSNS